MLPACIAGQPPLGQEAVHRHDLNEAGLTPSALPSDAGRVRAKLQTAKQRHSKAGRTAQVVQVVSGQQSVQQQQATAAKCAARHVAATCSSSLTCSSISSSAALACCRPLCLEAPQPLACSISRRGAAAFGRAAAGTSSCACTRNGPLTPSGCSWKLSCSRACAAWRGDVPPSGYEMHCKWKVFNGCARTGRATGTPGTSWSTGSSASVPGTSAQPAGSQSARDCHHRCNPQRRPTLP